MSSLRNAVARPTHRERAQPLERSKWGILEKHKDYSLRAKNFAEKRRKLRTLRQKAAERNPDEFAFSMMSSKQGRDGTRIGDRGNKALSVDVVKLMKTQDVRYIRTMANVTRKERERLEGEGGEEERPGITLFKPGKGSGSGKYTVFVNDAIEQHAFDATSQLDKRGMESSSSPHLVGESLELLNGEIGSMNNVYQIDRRVSERQAARERVAEIQKYREEKKRQKQQETKQRRIEELRKREQELKIAEEEIEGQRARMSGAIGGVNKNGVKFKVRERKR
ncbi:U3 small nucleolar RNA-associated protein 11 [Patellaria atrata CBS 101060]|uniref:U3 small nucleolar RNA-associated protein 11 n=1 Tax=Patellaria atrata CBS 101060 TaxID=1346257 RepID=A0A9P4SBI2_9PEZI|nr:U3 small nucleolar RNA-associated protein 11 [Patellaria atrata CBS 101060]